MKIAQSKNTTKQPGIRTWIELLIHGRLRWVTVSGLIMLGVVAGFLYSWRYVPRNAAEFETETTPTPVPILPTTKPATIEDIDPLPEMQISFSLSDTDGSADLIINQSINMAIAIEPIKTEDDAISGWHIVLPDEEPSLLIAGKQFQLIPAEQGQAVSTWLYLQEMREAGIFVPDMIPCLVSINDASQQVYYLVADVEAAKSPQDLIFQIPEAFFTVNSSDTITQYTLLAQLQTSAMENQSELNQSSFQQWQDQLSEMMKHPADMHTAMDIPLFADYFAIHDLWAAAYQSDAAVMYYLYNSVSNKIEPAIVDLDQVILAGDGSQKSFPFSDNPLFNLTELQITYIQSLEERAAVERFDEFEERKYPIFHAYEKQIKTATETPYSTTWELLNFRHQMMRIQVDPPYPLRGFVYADAGAECVNVSLLNLMVVPVDVSSIMLLGEEIPLQLSWLQNPLEPAVLHATNDLLRLRPFADPDTLMHFCVPTVLFEEILVAQEVNKPLSEVLMKENTWMVNAQLSGLQKEYTVAMIPDLPPRTGGGRDMPPTQSVEQLTSMFPFIKVNSAGNTLTFQRGSWQVDEDIVIPAGLTVKVEAGCQLYFSSDTVLLSFSALQAQGTQQEPVIFSASTDTWPGLVVINAEDESLLEHVIIEKTGGIERGGWILTGGVTFYRSPLVLRNATLQDSMVEDAINVIRTTFLFDHLTIQRTPSDAFDADFANGEIVSSHFEDIGGDAVDTSGAVVSILDTTMLNIVDKGLSAGENSQMSAENVSMTNMGIGGAAKDLSTLTMHNVVIENARVAGLAAYIKKSVYGPSTIEAVDVDILNSSTKTLVQTGSRIIWNGKEQNTQDLNVKTLYALGILGN
ncbi:MAG: hypothetical protein JEZ00_17170 [Anaerolineaceae bacterium]|nr:hypothetical protein [Anaerolineaceae bacterium]